MAIVRKYQPGKGWSDIASDDAQGIYTDHPILTSDPEGKSIEDVLIEQQSDIELLKKNVSWLALHGGGGYGAGGGTGPSSNSAKVIIIDPLTGQEGITQLIWSGISFIKFKVFSNKSSSTYTVHVKVGSATKYTLSSVARNTTITVSASTLGIRSESTTLHIFAYDAEGNEFSASCAILVPSITFSTTTPTFTIVQSSIPIFTDKIRFYYSVAIPGEYYMVYNTSSITTSADEIRTLINNGQFINLGTISTANSQIRCDVDIKDPKGDGETPGFIDENTRPGVYPVNFILVSQNNYGIFSSVVNINIAVTESNTIAIIPLIGATTDNPYSCRLDGSFDIRFKVVGNDTGSISYRISQGTWISNLGRSSMNTETSYTINLGTLGLDSSIVGSIIVFHISVESNRYTAEGDVYVLVTTSSVSRLEKYLEKYRTINSTTGNDVVFDYTVDTYMDDPFSERSGSTVVVTQPCCGLSNESRSSLLTFNQVGVDTEYNGFSIQLNHRAYAEISRNSNSWNWINNGSGLDYLINAGENGITFTLDIAFEIKHVGKNSTILTWGNISTENPDNIGFLITSSGYTVKLFNTTLTGDLQENEFYHLCFVFDGYNLSVFKNGLYDGFAQNINVSANITDVNKLNSNNIIIGCEKIQNNYVNYTNVKLYSIRLFRSALNIGDVVCSYINNVVCNTTTGDKNAELFSELMNSNLLHEDTESGLERSGISDIYSFTTGKFNWGFENSNVTFGENLPAALEKIPIPMVFITTQRLWSEFTATGESDKMIPDDQARFSYHPGSGKGSMLKSPKDITLSIQGTTTTGYKIKNLDITFDQFLTFSPKETWYPENSFTLKADVVDSGHFNNAVIGKFVNNCYNSTSSFMNNSPQAFPAKGYFSRRSSYFGTINTKACIEGFPVMLFVAFDNGNDIRSLGIYSFNLGRDSQYNQGLTIPDGVYEYNANGEGTQILTKDELSFPRFYGIPKTDNVNRDYAAICIEGVSVRNCSTETKTDFTDTDFDSTTVVVLKNSSATSTWKQYYLESSLKVIDGYVYFVSGNQTKPVVDDNGEMIPWNSNHVTRLKLKTDGYFWSTGNAENAYNHIMWSSKFHKHPFYFRNTEDTFRDKNVWGHFADLGDFISRKLPYKKGGLYFKEGSKFFSYNYTPTSGGTTASINENVEIKFPQQPENTLISIYNTAFYYVVAMLFGLVDSLGKNLQLKVWLPRDTGSTYYWSPTFYDMDTALGLNNAGEERITPNVLDYFIYNDPFGEVYDVFATNEDPSLVKYEVTGNKLWGFDDPELISEKYYLEEGFASVGDSYSAFIWNKLRSTFIKDADSFVDEYIRPQLQGCSLFSLNADFEVKYVNSPQYEMLHGTRIDKIRTWLRKRIIFLDSLFEYKAGSSAETNYLSLVPAGYEIPLKDVITILNGSNTQTIPIKTTAPAIITTTVGQNISYRKYIKDETLSTIRVSNMTEESSTGAGSAIQTTINNSSIIDDINLRGNFNLNYITNYSQSEALDSSGVAYYSGAISNTAYYNYGNFRSLKVWDLNSTKVTNNIDLFTLFKSWDTSSINREPEPSLLQEINYSSITSDGTLRLELGGTLDTSVPAVYRHPFSNLVKIDISNSDIDDITIPEDISLMELNLDNSKIGKLYLKSQPLLKFPVPERPSDPIPTTFSGCRLLSEVSLDNCENLKYLKFDRTNSNLELVKVIECNNLESIIIDGNYEYIPNIIVQNCKNLKSINIINCLDYNNTEESIEITGCPRLNVVTIDNSNYNNIQLGKAGDSISEAVTSYSFTLTNLSKLDTLSYNNDLTAGVIDLRNILYDFSTFDLSNSTKLSKVWFHNGSGAIKISTSKAFGYCTGLTEIRGYIHITGSQAFYSCSNLNLTSLNYANFSWGDGVINNIPQKLYKPDTNQNLNIVISGSGAIGLCQGDYATRRGPKINFSSVYYLLGNLDKNITSISNMFYYCQGPSGGTNASVSDNRGNCWGSGFFTKCENVTSVAGLFFATDFFGASVTLKSPSSSSDDGFLSPLKKCTSFNNSNMFSSDVKCENNQFFRRRNGDYAFAGIDDFNAHILGATNNTGNLENFFENCPNLTYIDESFRNDSSIYTIDFSKNLNIPNQVTEIKQSFICRGTGTLVLKNLFKEPESTKSLKTISNSFVITGGSVTFTLNSNTFKTFDSLTSLKYYDVLNEDKITGDQTPFRGNGLTKYLGTTNLKSILQTSSETKKNWVRVDGLLRNCTVTTDVLPNNETLSLPGEMFKGQTNLVSARSCFQNIRIQNIALTSEGFASCTKLEDVSYLFAMDDRDANSNPKLSIPTRFFYHGSYSSGYITKTGTNNEIPVVEDNSVTFSGYKVFTYNDQLYAISTTYWNNGNIEPHRKIRPVEIEDDEPALGTSDYAGTLLNIATTQAPSYKYTIYRASIYRYYKCFYNCNFSGPYINTLEYNTTNLEVNPDYEPFKYRKAGTGWSKFTPTKKYIADWIYDGDRSKLTDEVRESIDGGIEKPKDPYIDALETDSTRSVARFGQKSYITDEHDTDPYFICPPDLLRYTKNNAGVSAEIYSTDTVHLDFLFAGCGSASSFPRDENVAVYGLTGRICPYMLKPIGTKLVHMRGMFQYCRWIGYYSETIVNEDDGSSRTSYYVIPKNFFSFLGTYSLHLDYTFSGISLPVGVNISVFPSSNVKYISKIFYRCSYLGTSTENRVIISNVFGNNCMTSTLDNVFSQATSVALPHDGKQYVEFSNVFFKKYTGYGSEIFYGYEKGPAGDVAKYTKHECRTSDAGILQSVNATVNTNIGNKNYLYYAETAYPTS